MSSQVVMETSLEGRAPTHRGKVRETYDLGDGKLLIIATDRLSALDIVFANGIPFKGEVLTQLSAWWFGQIGAWGVPHHFIDLVTAENEIGLLGFRLPPEYHGRSMLVRKAKRLDAECIIRGYLSGSGWKDYLRTGDVCGIPLPQGLSESEQLPQVLFTPSTKPDVGHDENISFKKLTRIIGAANAHEVRDRSLIVYEHASDVARKCGIIIADTKFEFGLIGREVILIDEVLTPDSSRFWPLDGYKPGGPQVSFDKQPVRDWLQSEIVGKRWKEDDPAPTLIPQLVEATSQRYLEILWRLTGEALVSST